MKPSAITPEYEPIKLAICRNFGVSSDELLSTSRIRHIVEARHAFITLMRESRRLSYKGVSRILGVDHTTAMHSVRRCKQLQDAYPKYRLAYTLCLKTIK